MTTTPAATPRLLERAYAVCLGTVMFAFASALTNMLPGAVSELGRWVALGTALLLGLLHRASQPPPFLLTDRAPGYLAVLLLVCYAASALSSVSPAKSQLYFLVCALQVVLFLFVARSLPAWIWRSLFRWLLMMCSIVTLLSMAGYLQSNENYVTQGRLSGLSNANTTGLVAMLGCLLSAAAMLSHTLDITLKSRALASAYALVLLVSLWVLYLTGSRGSLTGLVAGLAMLLYVRSSRLRANPVFVFSMITLALGSLLIDGLIDTERLAVYARGSDGDIFYTRRAAWTDAIELFNDAPWLGQGYGVHDARGFFIDGSGYFGLAASAGILATVCYFSLLLWLIRHTLAFFKRPDANSGVLRFNQDLLAASSACVVGLSAQGIGEPWMIGPGSFIHLIYWLCAGATIAAITVYQQDR